MTVKEKMQQVAEIFRDAQQRAEPLLKELQPYLDVARECERLGLTSESSGDEILDAFAGKVNLEIAAGQIVPQVLSVAAPREIREAGEVLTKASRTIGAIVGEIGGIALGLL